jgi:hypothetical protein
MAATILSGTATPKGNFTLYTNNTGQNVRLIIHHLFVHGAIRDAAIGSSAEGFYGTKRVSITGGSHGTLQLPASLYYQQYDIDNNSTTQVLRIRLGVGKGIAVEDRQEPDNVISDNSNGCVRTIIRDENNNIRFAEGPQVFPTEILMRSGQSMVFESSGSFGDQFISFNITVMPEGG